MSEKRKYDSTVARIAGNIASGCVSALSIHDGGMHISDEQSREIARFTVGLAREIVAEVERTEPAAVDAAPKE